MGINCDFSMYYAYYLDLNLDFTDKEYQVSKQFTIVRRLDIKLTILNIY